jgi:hypothetical protein
MIEVYPHPAIVSLFGLRFSLKYKAKRGRALSDRKAAFAELIKHLTTLDAGDPGLRVGTAPRWRLLCECVETAESDRQLDVLEDELDSFVCAYIGLYYWTHGTSRCRIVGDLVSGYIVTPVTHESGDRFDRLVLREVPSVARRTAAADERLSPGTRPAWLTADSVTAAGRASGTLCACGCGAAVRRRYLPGHDARHKEALIRRSLQGDTAAEMVLQSLGWTKFLEARRKGDRRGGTRPHDG